MLLGQPTKLQSQFRLTYSMILNLLRVEALRVEEMIKRSFSENAAQRLLPEHAKKVAEGESELKELRRLEPGPKTDELRKFYDLEQRIVELNTAVLDGVLAHPSSGRTMSAGRVVILSDGVRPPQSLSPSGSLSDVLTLAPTYSTSATTLQSSSSLPRPPSCRRACSTRPSSSSCSPSSRPRSAKARTVRRAFLSLSFKSTRC